MDSKPDGGGRQLADTVLEEFWFGEGDAREGDEEASRSLAAKLASVEGLRPTRDVADGMIGLFTRPDYTVHEVVQTLERDPALASRVIRAANAPWFSWGDPCRTIQAAIVRLGSDTVVDLAIATATMEVLRDVGGAGAAIRAHSAAVAGMVRVLALEYRPDCTGSIVLCGLFHDMGKLLLLQSGEFAYASRTWAPEAALHGNHEQEREYLGYDHAVLGAHVLHRWGIPDPIPRVVALHHQPVRALGAGGLVGPQVALLRMANRLEPLFRKRPERFDEKVADLADTLEARYLGLSERDLLRSWETLFYAFHEAVGLFGA